MLISVVTLFNVYPPHVKISVRWTDEKSPISCIKNISFTWIENISLFILYYKYLIFQEAAAATAHMCHNPQPEIKVSSLNSLLGQCFSGIFKFLVFGLVRWCPYFCEFWNLNCFMSQYQTGNVYFIDYNVLFWLLSQFNAISGLYLSVF